MVLVPILVLDDGGVGGGNDMRSDGRRTDPGLTTEPGASLVVDVGGVPTRLGTFKSMISFFA